VPDIDHGAETGRATPSLNGRTVLAVFAHPDDESLACGGTLARLADLGVSIVLMCASRGERGFISDSALVPDGDLGRARTHELHAAAKVLGVAEVLMLDHADGNLRWKDVPEFHAEIVRAIERYKPGAVITFGEDGLYWHLDHIGVHERTLTAVVSLGAAAPPLYYVSMSPGGMRHVIDAAVARGWEGSNGGLWGIVPDAFGLKTNPPTLSVDVRPWMARKLGALQCHRTQVGFANPFTLIDESEARRWLGIEYFRRSPVSVSSDPVLEHLGNGAVEL
jgi:LmbE family N-acetylglucosaminyl deacetylase